MAARRLRGRSGVMKAAPGREKRVGGDYQSQRQGKQRQKGQRRCAARPLLHPDSQAPQQTWTQVLLAFWGARQSAVRHTLGCTCCPDDSPIEGVPHVLGAGRAWEVKLCYRQKFSWSPQGWGEIVTLQRLWGPSS